MPREGPSHSAQGCCLSLQSFASRDFNFWLLSNASYSSQGVLSWGGCQCWHQDCRRMWCVLLEILWTPMIIVWVLPNIVRGFIWCVLHICWHKGWLKSNAYVIKIGRDPWRWYEVSPNLAKHKGTQGLLDATIRFLNLCQTIMSLVGIPTSGNMHALTLFSLGMSQYVNKAQKHGWQHSPVSCRWACRLVISSKSVPCFYVVSLCSRQSSCIALAHFSV